MVLYEIRLLDRNQKFFIKLNKVNYQLKLVYLKRWYLDIYQANAVIYAELSGDFPLGDSRQPTYKSLRP
ncbi:hypothetical protein ABTD75_18070, partial [Acinetobacter baumannii]